MSPKPDEGLENEVNPFLAYSDQAGVEEKKEDKLDEKEQILDAIGSNYLIFSAESCKMLICCVQSGESTSSTVAWSSWSSSGCRPASTSSTWSSTGPRLTTGAPG